MALALAIALVLFVLVLQYVQQQKPGLNTTENRAEPSTIVSPEAQDGEPESLEDPDGALVESEEGSTNEEKEEGNTPKTDDAPREPNSVDNEASDLNNGN